MSKDLKDDLTSETLNKRFKSSFDLVNYAISLATEMVTAGREPSLDESESGNIAMAVLDEIAEGRDRLKPIKKQKAEIQVTIAESDEALLNLSHAP